MRFRRWARNVSSFVSIYSQIWNLALVFLLIPGGAAFLNEVYPNRISTSQIRLGLSSWAGRRGPGCASDRRIGGWFCPGFSAWYPAPRVHDIYIQLYPGDTIEARPPSVLLSRHALVPGLSQWSSSVRRSRVRPRHLQRPPTLFLLLINIDKLKKKTDPFGDFRGRPHWTDLNLNYDSDQILPKLDFLFVPYALRLSFFFFFFEHFAPTSTAPSTLG